VIIQNLALSKRTCYEPLASTHPDRQGSGDFVGDGDLQVGIAAKTTFVGAGFDHGCDIGWRHIKVCGHATFKVNGNTVTVSGCIGISV
jgi:hypothetical protein